MILLALDQSSHTSGYSIFDQDKLIAYDKFSFDDKDMGLRLTKIRNKIISIIKEYKVEQIVFEDIQQQNNVANNVQTFKVLAQVQGVILQLVNEMHIPYDIILASIWKSKLGIKGKTRVEQKKNAQIYISNKYNISVIQDIVDSICIGESYLQDSTGAWD